MNDLAPAGGEPHDEVLDAQQHAVGVTEVGGADSGHQATLLGVGKLTGVPAGSPTGNQHR